MKRFMKKIMETNYDSYVRRQKINESEDNGMIDYDKEKITDIRYIRNLLEGKYICDGVSKNFLFIKSISFYTNANDYTLKLIGVVVDFKHDDVKSIKVGNVYTPPLESFLQKSHFITKKDFTSAYDEVMEERMKVLNM